MNFLHLLQASHICCNDNRSTFLETKWVPKSLHLYGETAKRKQV